MKKTPAKPQTTASPKPNRQFWTMGGACQLLQVVPAELEAKMRAAGVAFSHSVDGVPMLRGSDLAKLQTNRTNHA